VLRAGGEPEENAPCLADLLGAEIARTSAQGRVGIAGASCTQREASVRASVYCPARPQRGGGVRSELRLGQLLHRLLVTRGRIPQSPRCRAASALRSRHYRPWCRR